MEDLETDYRKEKVKKRRKKRGSALPAVFLIVIMLITIIVMAVILIAQINKTRKVEEYYAGMVVMTQDEYESKLLEASQEGEAKGASEFREDIKTQCESGSNSMVKLLRKWYPEYVVYNTKSGYVFAQINDSLAKLDIDATGLIKAENGDMEYYVGDEKVSKKGIDVSKFQGEINWKKVKASGVDYAIVRVGIRGYGSGKLVLDETLEDNLKNAGKAGMPIGAYFVTQAISVEEAKEEADLVIEALKGYKLEYPVYIDVEEPSDSEARTVNLSTDERTDYTIAFLERLKEAGYDVGIYGNVKTFMAMLDASRLEEYSKWYAFYDDYIYFPYDVDMWQYSEKGTVDGIDEKVDLNITLK